MVKWPKDSWKTKSGGTDQDRKKNEVSRENNPRDQCGKTQNREASVARATLNNSPISEKPYNEKITRRRIQTLEVRLKRKSHKTGGLVFRTTLVESERWQSYF